jgi:hypothetical protein
VTQGIEAFIARHKPDELLITANVFEHAARRHSFEIAAACAGCGCSANPRLQLASRQREIPR